MKLTLRDLETRLTRGIATIEDVEAFDPEEVVEAKRSVERHVRVIANAVSPRSVFPAASADAKAKTPSKKKRQAELDEAIENGTPIVRTYAATVQTVDRLGDLVMTRPKKGADTDESVGDGFQTENLLATGGAFLWSHMAASPAIGQVSDPRQRRIETREGLAWATLEDVRYIPDERIPYAIPAVILLDEGVLRAVSVGFVGVKVWYPDDEKVRAKLGLKRYGVVFVTSDQTELSQAQTPAHQFALAQGKSLDGAIEKAAERVLRRAVEEGRIPESLRVDFVRACPLGPLDEAERLASKVAGFEVVTDVRIERSDETPEEQAEVEHEERDLIDDLSDAVKELDELYVAMDLDPEEEDVHELAIGYLQGVRRGVSALRAELRELLPGETVFEVALATLQNRGARDDETGDPGGGLPSSSRALLGEAFEAFSKGTELLVELLDGTPESKGLDETPPASQDREDFRTLARSIEALADSIRASGRFGEEVEAFGGFERADGEDVRGASVEGSEVDSVSEAVLGRRLAARSLQELS